MAGPPNSQPPNNNKKKPAGCIEETGTVQRLLADNNPWVKVWDEDVEGEDVDTEIVFSPRGRYAAVSLQGGGVLIWDLSTLPHTALQLDVPAHMPMRTPAAAITRQLSNNRNRSRGGGGRSNASNKTRDRGDEEVDYVIAGLSWSSQADKLLVTYHQQGGSPSSYLCKWNIPTAEVEAHHHCPGQPIGPAQLSPVDESLCAYFVGGSSCLRLQRLGEGGEVREKGVSSSSSNSSSNAEGSSATTTTTTASEDPRLGLCLFSNDGLALYCVCVRDRRVLKLDVSTLQEQGRSPDILLPGLRVLAQKLRLSPDGRCLFVFTNRAAHLIETEGMRAAEPLGDFGAIKVEWGCWSVGPERNQQQQQQQQQQQSQKSQESQQQLVVVGVPCPFSGDSVQEGLFVWRVQRLGGTAAAAAGQIKSGENNEDEDDEEGDEEDKANTGLPLVEPSPDILPGFIQGLQALELCPRRALLLGGDCHGGLFVQSERFTTGFPGPMYAPGYTILGNNRTYLEKEEELDKVVVPEGGGEKGREEEKEKEAVVPDEEGEVDVMAGVEEGGRGGGGCDDASDSTQTHLCESVFE